MKKQQAKNKKHNQITLITSWQHIQEPNPSLKRLMMLLLKPRDNSLVKRKVFNNFQRKTDTEPDTDPETDTEPEPDTER